MNYVVLKWTVKFNVKQFKKKSREVCITWKVVGFLQFCIFPVYKNINMLKPFLKIKELYGLFFMDGA